MVLKNSVPFPIFMPALSPTMTSGRLSKWHKSVGQEIQSGDLLMDVETDKAVMEVESTHDGILDMIVIPGDTDDVKVGQIIAVLRAEDEDVGVAEDWLARNPCTVSGHSEKNISNSTSDTSEKEINESNSQGMQPLFVGASQTASDDEKTDQNKRIIASPLAKKMAKDTGVDLSLIKGSGPRGRIVKKDVEKALSVQPRQALVQDDVTGLIQTTRIDLTPMRKGIAKRLTASKTTVPHFYLSVDCDMGAMLELRAKMNQEEKIFSINDFIVRACALALEAVPGMRVIWADTHLIQHHTSDVAVAVSVDGGLVTPVVRQAERKSLRVLSQEMKQWIEKSRSGSLNPEDYQGGVFTISNLGMMGVDSFYPILNPPHAGILAIGATRERPVVRDGQLAVAWMMTASLAADHRAVDGACGADFLNVFRSFVENPYRLLS